MLEQLVLSLDQMGEKLAAVTVLDALARNSTMFQQYDDVAKCYFKIKEYEKALKYAELALTSAPTQGLYPAKYNVINVANHANYPERAMTLIKQLEIINPNDLDVKLEKAFSFFLLNQKDKAEAILRTELDNPKHDEMTKTKIRFNLGTYELLRDEFQSGLRKFLFEGRKLEYWKKPSLPFKFWEGQIDEGKTIVIRAEAGIGDEFINVRFMKHLRGRGMNPIWFSERKDIASIFNRNGFKTVSDVRDIKDKDAYWTHSMDLPVYLNLEYKDLWAGSYLKAKEDLVKHYDAYMPKDKLRIGLRWQGNPGYDQDLHRSIPLDDMYGSLMYLDANFFSIQRDTGLEELCDYNIEDYSKYLTDFDQTLAIIENLDVLITSCTSVAHASAAMGKRTIIITPISAYYTWCHSMKQSPWYGDHVTILRQQKPRVWDEPLAELKEIMNAEFGNR
jgi:tetratricopeptide (TPR) repeat protein